MAYCKTATVGLPDRSVGTCPELAGQSSATPMKALLVLVVCEIFVMESPFPRR
jgi:hypothetical protein